MEEKKKELLRAISCLRLELDSSIVDDIKAKALAYINEVEKQLSITE